MDRATEIVRSINDVTLGEGSPAESGPAESKPRGERKAKKAAKAPVDATPLEVIRLLLRWGFFWAQKDMLVNYCFLAQSCPGIYPPQNPIVREVEVRI